MTDAEGTYTIRNITGGTYTLKAALQGFKEFVQTGIPITAGGIVRINGRLEVGTLSEAVTVTTEAVLLKTDKADVSVDLRPEDVTNLPLNQYRNYQYLMNLVPGATPPEFQNAQTTRPREDQYQWANRNNNVTRIDAPPHQRGPAHHAATSLRRDDENSHLDQQLRRGQGMTWARRRRVTAGRTLRGRPYTSAAATNARRATSIEQGAQHLDQGGPLAARSPRTVVLLQSWGERGASGHSIPTVPTRGFATATSRVLG